MDSDTIKALIAATAATITQHADELTDLDRAIGDADHGINMKRGFDALVSAQDEIAAMALPEALQKAGMTLVMTVGGASGPLYGSLLMAMGKGSPPQVASVGDVAGMLADGIGSVKARGKSDVGAKTMLDVLVPVHQALQGANGDGAAIIAAVRHAAAAAVAATRDMQASKGRASFLGERSVGHIDPGARSSELLIAAVCDVIGQRIGGAA